VTDYWEGVEQVIADDLRFRLKLRIGRNAYRVLKARDAATTLAGSAGAAWAGAGVVGSKVVATTFFAPTGIAAWLGLATAVTPVGWVVAAAVAAGGAYYGATRYLFASNGGLVDEVPKFITSSVGVLGAALFDLIGALAIRVALSDGHFAREEREVIMEHLVQDWGFDPGYAHRAFAKLEANSDEGTIAAIARALADFQAAHPDCNAKAMQNELVVFLEQIIRVDGAISRSERLAIEQVRSALGM
jgi:tellurite resistance protein